MPRKKPCPAPGTRRYGTKSRYTPETLQNALDDITNCRRTQQDAADFYDIPRSTLKYKLKDQHNKPFGKPIALTEEEEQSIVSHVIVLSELGLPLGMLDVRVIVKKYLDENKRNIKQFKNNFPGWEWGRGFLERHTCLKAKLAHQISRKRAQVNQEMIEKFFDHLAKELEGVPPENIYNFDETGFHDEPKKRKLLFRRECRNPEIIQNSTKSCFTVMFCSSAKGEFVPLYIIYKAKQKWSSWLMGAPPGTRMAVTKSGWIDADTFDDWFEYQLLPILKKKEGKKVIMGDNLSSHITTKTLRLCAENNITYICLIPNSTHLLQPLDVSYFSALKTNWRTALGDWRQTRRGKVVNALPKPVFAKLLTKTMQAGKETAAENVIAGFKACGISPLNRDVVLEKLKNYSKPIAEVQEMVGETFKKYLEEIRDSDLQTKPNKKFQMPIQPGKSVSVEEVEKYYEERLSGVKTKKKGNVKRNTTNPDLPEAPAKKRGRPPGVKNKAKIDITPTARTLSPIAGSSKQAWVSPSISQDNLPSRAPSPAVASNEDYRLFDNIFCATDIPSPIEQEVVIDYETTDDIIGEYRCFSGELQKIDKGQASKQEDYEQKQPKKQENETQRDLPMKNDEGTRQSQKKNDKELEHSKKKKKMSNEKENKTSGYCIIEHEESLFPGRILTEDDNVIKTSLMQKDAEGWKWPPRPDILTCSTQKIVSRLALSEVIRRGNRYEINNPALCEEWGD